MFLDKYCGNCNKGKKYLDSFNHCPQCGFELKPLPKKTFGGVGETHGVYRITLICEQEFYSEHNAEHAAGHSCIGEEEYDVTSSKVELIKLTALPETHSYICIVCKDDGENVYSKFNDIWCEWCHEKNWKKR